MTTRRLGSDVVLASLGAVEVALVVMHLCVVVSFGRLYAGWAFAGDLAVFTLAAHLLALVTRRTRIPATAGALVAVVGAALVAAWLLFPETAGLGLPTAATWHSAVAALREAGQEFGLVAPPAEPTIGFQLASGLALWAAAWFADWAAFRLEATAEAIAPAAILFIFGSVLASGGRRVAMAAAFCAAALTFAAIHRAWRSRRDRHWSTAAGPPGAVGPGSLARAGVATALVALVAGVVVGPRLPGASDEALLNWRESVSSQGQRTTVSPIVDLRRRLVSQTDVELFEVTANAPAYWRLTSLDRFDGQIWSSGGEYSKAGEKLSGPTPTVQQTRRLTQTVKVEALAAIWAPAAFEARGVPESSSPLRWDSESSTLIVDSSTTSSDGLTYSVVSEAPILDPDVLQTAPASDPAAVARRYTSLPGSFPRLARTEARRAVTGARTRYEQARMLQDYFRSGAFAYSTDVRPGHDEDALVAFLRNRIGYCEQFAGAYASMARSLGIPARVAVGFTPGDEDPTRPGVFHVRGIHAHAWPEVYFAGPGWVPFEPTPGRGIPDARQYTGVPPAQEHSTIVASTPATTTTTTSPSSSTTPRNRQPDNEVRSRAAVPPPTDTSETPPSLLLVLAVALATFCVWLLAMLVAPSLRRRRRGRHGGAAGRVRDAWDDALGSVRRLDGPTPLPSDTPAEYARTAGPGLGEMAPDLDELARSVTAATWDPSGVGPGDAQRAEELAGRLREHVTRSQPWTTRLRRRLSWREAFGVDSLTSQDLPAPLGS